MTSLYDRAQAQVKRLGDAINNQPSRGVVPHVPRQTYLYVFGITKRGRKLIDGPLSLEEADALLATLDDGEIFEYQTRDLAKASREIKAELWKRSGDADKALERVLHKKGLAREQGRERKGLLTI